MPETLRNALGRWLLDELSLIAIMESMGGLANTEGGTGSGENDKLLMLWPRLYFANSLIIVQRLS